MKFIFPQNYHFHTKLFGLLDYPTAILNFCWWIIMFLITKILPFPLLDKLIFFIITCFPLFLISALLLPQPCRGNLPPDCTSILLL